MRVRGERDGAEQDRGCLVLCEPDTSPLSEVRVAGKPARRVKPRGRKADSRRLHEIRVRAGQVVFARSRR